MVLGPTKITGLNALDLWGIAEIGVTLICDGISPFDSLYSTRCVRFDSTLIFNSAEKWAIALSSKVESCGTLMAAVFIYFLFQSRPVLTGETPVAYSNRVSYAG